MLLLIVDVPRMLYIKMCGQAVQEPSLMMSLVINPSIVVSEKDAPLDMLLQCFLSFSRPRSFRSKSNGFSPS